MPDNEINIDNTTPVPNVGEPEIRFIDPSPSINQAWATRMLNEEMERFTARAFATPHVVVTGSAGFIPYAKTLTKESGKVSKNNTVKLFESGTKCKVENAVYVSRIEGWFSKDDPNIHRDILDSTDYISTDPKFVNYFKHKLCVVYSGIDEKGNLINPTYTVSTKVSTYFPVVYNSSISSIYGCANFIALHLVNNSTFKEYYKESLRDGVFYSINDFDKKWAEKNTKIQYRKCKSTFKLAETSNIPTTYMKTLGKKYSFGLEIETSSGFLPTYLDTILDYSAVHDGSLKDSDGHTWGGEYVTGVFKGDRGLLQSKLLCNELSKRCLINSLCGVHTHIGDVNFTKENIVLMYYLYKKLEDEIFSMLPISRRKNEYCKKLPEHSISLKEITSNYNFMIDYYYNEVISILSQTDGCSTYVNKKKDHPKGHKCNYDRSTARYCWVNFIPAVFDTRGNGVQTIEFRPHSATTSYYKIKNWLLICMALVDIVENHKDSIYKDPNLSLGKIIRIVYPKHCDKLLDYIEKRINKFSSKDNEESDYTDNEVDELVTIKNI